MGEKKILSSNSERRKQDEVATIGRSRLSLPTQLLHPRCQSTALILFTQKLGRSWLNKMGLGKVRAWGASESGELSGALTRPGSPAAKFPLEDTPPVRMRGLRRAKGVRDPEGGGNRAEEAANETRSREPAGKGGKGQRAAEESEKGKLCTGGKGRRPRRREGAREKSLWQSQAVVAEGTRRGGGPARTARPRRPAPAGDAARREAGGPRGRRPWPGRAGRPRRGDAARPRHVRILTFSQQGRSGKPVRSV